MKIERIDNHYAVRLPDDMVERLGLHEGDEVHLTLTPQKADRPLTKAERHELIEGLRRYEGTMPAGFKFDREEANAR